MIKVKKKEGQIEDFDRSKISNGITKAGATPDQAEKITGQVEGWAQKTAVDEVIDASQIKTKVLQLLQSVNPEAAKSFSSYQKSVWAALLNKLKKI